MRLPLTILASCLSFIMFSTLVFGRAQGRRPTRPVQTPTPAATQQQTAPQTAQLPQGPDSQTAAQEPALSDEDKKLLGEILIAEQQSRLNALLPADSDKKVPGTTDKLAGLYARAVRSPRLVQLLIGQSLTSYFDLKEGARGAVQVSQAADEAGIKFQLIIMAQNQRIIELLEQIAKRR